MTTKRLLAQLIDFVAYHFAASSVLILSILLFANLNVDESTKRILMVFVLITAGFVSLYIYFYLQYKHIVKGQSWGYKLMGIKLVYPENSNNKKLALIRTILRPFMGLLAITSIVVAVWHMALMMSSDGKEGLMDSLLKTSAVEV